MDRLGSIRGGKDYFPYGQENSTTTAGDKEKYATYRHDAATDLSYADQRYYATGAWRFMTADPYRASAGAGDPGSWNRYAYASQDPVNLTDPSGLVSMGDIYGDQVPAFVFAMFGDLTGFQAHEAPYACAVLAWNAGIGAVNTLQWDSLCSPYMLGPMLQFAMAVEDRARQDRKFIDCLNREINRLDRQRESKIEKELTSHKIKVAAASAALGLALHGAGPDPRKAVIAIGAYSIAVAAATADMHNAIDSINREHRMGSNEAMDKCKKEAYGDDSTNVV